MGIGWTPRQQKPARALQQAAGPQTGPQAPPSILASPPGTAAPMDAINYTPATGEVHQPGVLAPVDQLNYSLLPQGMLSRINRPQPQTPYGAPGDIPIPNAPNNAPPHIQEMGARRGAGPLAGMGNGGGYSAGMGMGADIPGTTIGADITSGSESMTGRYGKQPSTRMNLFTPGQPPLSPHPYGVGPGPRATASGPQARPMQQRGSSYGNLQHWGMGGGQEMGAGQQKLNTPGLTTGGTSTGSSGGVQGSAAPGGGGGGGGIDPSSTDYPDTGTQTGGGGSASSSTSDSGSGDNKPAEVPSGWHVDGDPNDATGVLFLVNGDGSQRIPYAVPGDPDPATGVRKPHYISDADVKRMLGEAAKGKSPVKVDTYTTDADGTKHYVTEYVNADNPSQVEATYPRSPNAAEAAQDAKAAGDTTGALNRTPTFDDQGNPVWRFYDRNGNQVGQDIPRSLTTSELNASGQGSAASSQAVENTRAAAQVAGYTPFTVQNINGQNYLFNQHDGTLTPIGTKDPTQGVFSVGNQLVKISDDGKTGTVIAQAPRGWSNPTQVGANWVSVNLDDPSQHVDLGTDPTYIPGKQATIDESKANIVKILNDVQTGKITAEQAKVNLAVAAHDITHPAVQSTSGGLLVPPGADVNIDPSYPGKKSPVQHVTGGPLDPQAQQISDSIQAFLSSPDASLNSDAANRIAASIGVPIASGTAAPTDAANAAQATKSTTASSAQGVNTTSDLSLSPGVAGTENDPRFKNAQPPMPTFTGLTQGEQKAYGVDSTGAPKGSVKTTSQAGADVFGGTVPPAQTPADTGKWPNSTDPAWSSDYGLTPDIKTVGWNPSQQQANQQPGDYAGIGSTLDVGLQGLDMGGGQETQTQTPTYPGVGSTLNVGLGTFKQGGQSSMLQPQPTGQQPGVVQQPQNPVQSPDIWANWDPTSGAGHGPSGGGTRGGMGGSGIGGGGGAGAEEGGDDLPDMPDDDTGVQDPTTGRPIPGKYPGDDYPIFGDPPTPGGERIPPQDDPGGGQQVIPGPELAPRGKWPTPPDYWPRIPEDTEPNPDWNYPGYPKGTPPPGFGGKTLPEDIQNAKMMMDPLYHFAMSLRDGGAGAGHSMGSGQVPTPPPPAPGGATAQPGANAGPGWTPPVPPQQVAGIGHRFGQQMDQGEPSHSGVDLQAPEGSNTISPVDGKVERVEHNPAGLGLTVVIRDAQGMEHRLGHLQSTVAYPGMVVAQGQSLARVGSTGNTTGAHLHWGVKDPQGVPQDPTPALPPQMQQMPPVPGTQMMGPPGGTGGDAQVGAGQSVSREDALNTRVLSPPIQYPGQEGGWSGGGEQMLNEPPLGTSGWSRMSRPEIMRALNMHYAMGSGQGSSMPALGAQSGANTQSPDYQAGYQAGLQASTSPGTPPIFVPGFSQPIPTASDSGGGDQSQMGGGAEGNYSSGYDRIMAEIAGNDMWRRNQGQMPEAVRILPKGLQDPRFVGQQVPQDYTGLGGGQDESVPTMAAGSAGDIPAQLARVGGWAQAANPPRQGWDKLDKINNPVQQLPAYQPGGYASDIPGDPNVNPGLARARPQAPAPFDQPQGGVAPAAPRQLMGPGPKKLVSYGGGQDQSGPADWWGLGPGEDSEINQQMHAHDPQTPWSHWWRDMDEAVRQYDKDIHRAHTMRGSGAGQDTFNGRGLTPQMGRGSTGAGWNPRFGTGQDSMDTRWDLYEQKDMQPFMGAGAAGTSGMGAGDVSTEAGRDAVRQANPGMNMANFNNAVANGATEQQAIAAGMGTSGGNPGNTFQNPADANTQARVAQAAQQAQDQLQVGMAQVNQSIQAENDHHNEVMAQLQQNAQFHQDDVALQQAINQETQRHDQATEKLQAQATQMQQTIEQMREANAVTLQQMQEGTQIYMQQGQQAFQDWQNTQSDRMQILSSALNNPWLQQLAGMTPTPGQDMGAVTAGNIQNLVNQILQPFNVNQYGVQNAPSQLQLNTNPNFMNPNAVAGALTWDQLSQQLQKMAGSNYNDQAAKSMYMNMTGQSAGNQTGNQLTQSQLDQIVQAGSNGTISSWAALNGQGQAPTAQQQAQGGQQGQTAQQTANTQATTGQPTLPQQQTGGLTSTSGQTPTWNQWSGWDPFQMAAYRTDIEAMGPGAWNAQQANLEQQFAAAGGSPNVTQMQAVGASPTQSAGQQMTANVFGQTTPEWQQNQQKQWSQSQAPQVQSNLSGIAA